MLTILVGVIPSLITLGILRARKRPTKEIFALLGWRLSSLRYYLFGEVLALVQGGLAELTLWLFARDLLFHPAAGTTEATYAHLTLSPVTILYIFVSVVFSTLGEELFFRGLLGGWLMKQCGFFVGNTIQALLFGLALASPGKSALLGHVAFCSACRMGSGVASLSFWKHLAGMAHVYLGRYRE